MLTEKRLKQIVVKDLEEYKISCFLEKQEIKETMFGIDDCEVEKLQKHLCFLSVRITAIDFALSEHKKMESSF